MLVLGIIFLILLLIALLRFGFIVEYSDEGLQMWYKIGFFRFSLSDDGKEKKPKISRDKESAVKLPGDFSAFIDIFNAVKSALDRFRRRLLIKELTLYYSSAGEDAAKTAMVYGAGNAAFGFLLPVLDRNFRLKKRDLRVFADFESTEPRIYAKVRFSLAVWEAFYIVFAFLPILKTVLPVGSRR
ncbi:MAG: DUF2953 domain-containing protein [Oscillospiraceae bacterium]|nr:DUF2953 domain-containing protein [Oscillospiraceae bacterium]MCL2277838.1 DUF2953 domain-containing protein [Oscillospiraceae bacterium]